MYRSVTDGKFSEALRQVNALLAVIPLTVVATRHEVDELKELISIARSAFCDCHSATHDLCSTQACGFQQLLHEGILIVPYPGGDNVARKPAGRWGLKCMWAPWMSWPLSKLPGAEQGPGGCREYSIGLRCEIERKDPEKDLITKNPKRTAELAAYFTHAKLQGSHEVLSLRSAMTQFYKLENYATAAIFARRLLEKSQTPAKVRFSNAVM